MKKILGACRSCFNRTPDGCEFCNPNYFNGKSMKELIDQLLRLGPYIAFLAVAVGGFNLTMIAYYTGHTILAVITAIVFIIYVGWMQRKYILETENEKDG